MVLAINVPVIEHANVMACEYNICKLPIARPALSNIPIWGTVYSILKLSKLVALKKIMISCSPVLVPLGGTTGEVRRGGSLESMARDFYKRDQTQASEMLLASDEPLTQCYRRPE